MTHTSASRDELSIARPQREDADRERGRTRSSSVTIASNRGPLSFHLEGGSIVPEQSAGGLAAALSDAIRCRDVSWVAAPVTAGDVEVAEREDGRVVATFDHGCADLRFVQAPREEFRRYYEDFSNRVLWFLHHGLQHASTIGQDEAELAWDAYTSVNRRFAEAVAEEAAPGGVVLSQDYHLATMLPKLRTLRPDLRVAHFWHIPFATPEAHRALPLQWTWAILAGLLSADIVGFHTRRWADNFIATCRDVLGAFVADGRLQHPFGETIVGVYPIGVDPHRLAFDVSRPEVARETAALDQAIGDRALILRVDRTDLSKNTLLGLQAYERLLERRPEMQGRVSMVAMLIPSRLDIPEYRAYHESCLAQADRINARFGRGDWMPVRVDMRGRFARTLAAYLRYDVLFVNPVFDGMNLVAREGPQVNERDGVLVLSRDAGAAESLGDAALTIDPLDVDATVSALEAAVTMSRDSRRGMAGALRTLSRGTSSSGWLNAQLADLARVSHR